MVVNAPSIITGARGSDLVVKIKSSILQSDHPTTVNYMRKVDAIRQLYGRLVLVSIFGLLLISFCIHDH
jgi:hypothetical protein